MLSALFISNTDYGCTLGVCMDKLQGACFIKGKLAHNFSGNILFVNLSDNDL